MIVCLVVCCFVVLDFVLGVNSVGDMRCFLVFVFEICLVILFSLFTFVV